MVLDTWNKIKAVNSIAMGFSTEELKDLLRELDKTETFGPLLEPRAFLNQNIFPNLRAMREVTQAFLAYRKALDDALA